MNGLWVLGGLIVAVGTVYAVTWVLLRRALDREVYHRETAARLDAARWRRRGNVVYLPDGYYAPIPEQPKGGGSDEAQELGLVPHLGLVTRGSLAGGKGSSYGPPCKYCGAPDGHTGQCPTVS